MYSHHNSPASSSSMADPQMLMVPPAAAFQQPHFNLDEFASHTHSNNVSGVGAAASNVLNDSGIGASSSPTGARSPNQRRRTPAGSTTGSPNREHQSNFPLASSSASSSPARFHQHASPSFEQRWEEHLATLHATFDSMLRMVHAERKQLKREREEFYRERESFQRERSNARFEQEQQQQMEHYRKVQQEEEEAAAATSPFGLRGASVSTISQTPSPKQLVENLSPQAPASAAKSDKGPSSPVERWDERREASPPVAHASSSLSPHHHPPSPLRSPPKPPLPVSANNSPQMTNPSQATLESISATTISDCKTGNGSQQLQISPDSTPVRLPKPEPVKNEDLSDSQGDAAATGGGGSLLDISALSANVVAAAPAAADHLFEKQGAAVSPGEKGSTPSPIAVVEAEAPAAAAGSGEQEEEEVSFTLPSREKGPAADSEPTLREQHQQQQQPHAEQQGGMIFMIDNSTFQSQHQEHDEPQEENEEQENGQPRRGQASSSAGTSSFDAYAAAASSQAAADQDLQQMLSDSFNPASPESVASRAQKSNTARSAGRDASSSSSSSSSHTTSVLSNTIPPLQTAVGAVGAVAATPAVSTGTVEDDFPPAPQQLEQQQEEQEHHSQQPQTQHEEVFVDPTLNMDNFLKYGPGPGQRGCSLVSDNLSDLSPQSAAAAAAASASSAARQNYSPALSSVGGGGSQQRRLQGGDFNEAARAADRFFARLKQKQELQQNEKEEPTPASKAGAAAAPQSEAERRTAELEQYVRRAGSLGSTTSSENAASPVPQPQQPSPISSVDVLSPVSAATDQQQQQHHHHHHHHQQAQPLKQRPRPNTHSGTGGSSSGVVSYVYPGPTKDALFLQKRSSVVSATSSTASIAASGTAASNGQQQPPQTQSSLPRQHYHDAAGPIGGVSTNLVAPAVFINVWPALDRECPGPFKLNVLNQTCMAVVLERAAKLTRCQPVAPFFFSPDGRRKIKTTAELETAAHYLVVPSGTKYSASQVPTALLMLLAAQG